jgi:hypothetical protein
MPKRVGVPSPWLTHSARGSVPLPRAILNSLVRCVVSHSRSSPPAAPRGDDATPGAGAGTGSALPAGRVCWVCAFWSTPIPAGLAVARTRTRPFEDGRLTNPRPAGSAQIEKLSGRAPARPLLRPLTRHGHLQGLFQGPLISSPDGPLHGLLLDRTAPEPHVFRAARSSPLKGARGADRASGATVHTPLRAFFEGHSRRS